MKHKVLNIGVIIFTFLLFLLAVAMMSFSVAKAQQVNEAVNEYMEEQPMLQESPKGQELAEAVDRMQSMLKKEHLYNTAILVLLLGIIAAIYLLVIVPFHKYAFTLLRADGSFVPLQPVGSRPTREFAEAFNRIYFVWKHQNNQLEEERFRFHVAMENTPVVVFEYTLATDKYKAYGLLDVDSEKADKNGVPIERVFSDFLRNQTVGSEGIQKLVKTEGGTLEQLISFNGSVIWARITATPIYDDDGHLVKLIGKIANIESERKKKLALEEMRSHDPLTGVYNKEAGIRLVQDYMAQKESEEICGIMLLDMDNFGCINKAEGSAFADAVLQETAEILCAYTGSDDYVVRLGGDEFMLFIKNCPKSRATVLGPQIAAAISGLSPLENQELSISVSIGMCVSEVVDEYNALYHCAESTLKYVKAHGKNRAACYLDTSNKLGEQLTQLYPEKHSINAIDRTSGTKEDIISFAVDLLNKSINLDDAIFLLLFRVGKQCGLDRISIIEVDAEYLLCRFTYQWVKSSSDNQIGQTHYISKEELRALTSAYDEDGLCEEYMVSSLEGIGSILHSAIWNRGVFEGVMTFERREKNYVWTTEERQILSELMKIISSFILKARADSVSQAKTEFLSRMSHEIRTPMNAIMGMTSIAKTALDHPEKMEQCLSKIETASTYLLSLINDILDMSRIESGKVELCSEPVLLSRRLESLDSLIRPQAEGKGLLFEIKNDFTKPSRILVDDLRLNQILINLLGNAVKFTSQGGITLQVETLEEMQETVTLKFAVSDTGIGIGEDAQKRIFNSFEQASSHTSTTYGGTGLGLAISSQLVQLMGGVLEVNSVPGEGSEFFFTLSFALAPPKEQADMEGIHREELPYTTEDKRLLLVEDNELNREIAEELLRLHGFTVETAVDGYQAVQLFGKNLPGYYDAVLMDIRMPVMDGIEATRQIRTMGKDDSRTVPIIAMTANAFNEDMEQSLASGMNAHLSKPIQIEQLLETLRQCITGGKNGTAV